VEIASFNTSQPISYLFHDQILPTLSPTYCWAQIRLIFGCPTDQPLRNKYHTRFNTITFTTILVCPKGLYDCLQICFKTVLDMIHS